jgi:hypothetical protein
MAEDVWSVAISESWNALTCVLRKTADEVRKAIRPPEAAKLDVLACNPEFARKLQTRLYQFGTRCGFTVRKGSNQWLL